MRRRTSPLAPRFAAPARHAGGLLLLALLTAPVVRAQRPILTAPEASPHARVEQTVGLTDLAVDYHRPAINGRTVWGGLVPYDRPWRAGANDNTTFETSTEVTVEGQTLPAGRYGFHLIPTQTGAWTVVFSTMADAWGSFTYDQQEDALRVTATPREAPQTERVSYHFDDVSDTTAVLVMRWERLELPIRVRVNTPEVVLASMTRELRGTPGFFWTGWYEIATYAVLNRTRLAPARMEAALGWVDSSIRFERNFGNLLLRAGILSALGRTADADAARAEALALPTSPFGQMAQVSGNLMAAGLTQDGVAGYRRITEVYPESWGGHFQLGGALAGTGDRAGARTAYERARALAPAAQHARIDAALARVR